MYNSHFVIISKFFNSFSPVSIFIVCNDLSMIWSNFEFVLEIQFLKRSQLDSLPVTYPQKGLSDSRDYIPTFGL